MPPAVSRGSGSRDQAMETWCGAVAQEVLDLLAQVGVVDDQVGKARRPEALDLPDDEGLAAGFQQGFGRVVGEGAHALAQAGGQDHGLEG
jgi:hypothetical protein